MSFSWLQDRGSAARVACWCCLGAALTIAAARPAGAQVSDDFRSRARIRAGALYLTPSFRFEQLGVDTNVFRTPEPQSDFVVSVSPRVDAWLPVQRRVLFSTTAIAGIDYYATLASERSFNPDVRSQVDVATRRFTFFAGGSYLRTRQRPQFEIDVRARRVEDSVNGGFAVDVRPRLAVRLEARRRRIRFDADAVFDGTSLSRTLNRREQSGIAAVEWSPTVLTTVALDTEFRRARFALVPERDNDNLIVVVRANFHPRALVSGTGYVGLRYFSGLGPMLGNIRRVVARAALTHQFTGSMRGTFTMNRDIGYSYEPLEPYYVLNQYRVGVTRALGRLFQLGGDVGRNVYDYEAGVSGRKEIAWFTSGTVGYRVTTTFFTGFRVSYINRSSTTRLERRYSGVEAGIVLDYGL